MRSKSVITFAIGCMFIIAIVGFIFTSLFGINTLVEFTGEYWVFNAYDYCVNIVTATGDFSSVVANNINVPPVKFDSVINALNSVANILISQVNLVLVPFQFVGILLNMLMAIMGLPCVGDNFLYNIFSTFASYGISYLPIQ